MNFSLATCVVLCFAFVAEAALVTQHCLAGLLPTSGKQQMHSAFLLCLCIRLFLSLLNCHYLGAWVFSPSFSLSCHVGEGSEWEKWIFSPCPRSNPYKIISLKCEKGATCHWFKATRKIILKTTDWKSELKEWELLISCTTFTFWFLSVWRNSWASLQGTNKFPHRNCSTGGKKRYTVENGLAVATQTVVKMWRVPFIVEFYFSCVLPIFLSHRPAVFPLTWIKAVNLSLCWQL